MRNRIRHISIIFLLIAIIPIGYGFYQINSLNKNEAVIKDIYNNQLDAILFSANLYSHDIINRNSIQITSALTDMNEMIWGEQLRDYLELFKIKYVKRIYLSANGQSRIFNLEGNEDSVSEEMDRMTALIQKNNEELEKLIRYKKSNYNKIRGLNQNYKENDAVVLFVIDHPALCGHVTITLTIDIPIFIEEILAPKLQEIAQGKFEISVLNKASNKLIYSTSDELNEELSKDKASKTKRDFWLFPNHKLSITLKGSNLEEIVQQNTAKNIYILLGLLMVLLFGIGFLYKNMVREMQLSNAKSEFVSNVSHEIRTPLSLISMFAETLELGRATSEEKKQEYYGIISKETARLSKLVNRILSFSKLSAGKKKYDFQDTSLHDVISEVLESYHYHFKENGFDFDLHKNSSRDLVHGDRESIIEVVNNLLDNAMKYSDDRKSISITIGTSGNFNFLEVADQGIGIPKTYQKDIFDQFFRVPTGDVHTTKGSGLGLALVQKIMIDHKGTVIVQSTPGKGSKFRLLFPAIT